MLDLVAGQVFAFVPISLLLTILSGYFLYSCCSRSDETVFVDLKNKTVFGCSAFTGLFILTMFFLLVFFFLLPDSFANCSGDDCIKLYIDTFNILSIALFGFSFVAFAVIQTGHKLETIKVLVWSFGGLFYLVVFIILISQFLANSDGTPPRNEFWKEAVYLTEENDVHQLTFFVKNDSSQEKLLNQIKMDCQTPEIFGVNNCSQSIPAILPGNSITPIICPYSDGELSNLQKCTGIYYTINMFLQKERPLLDENLSRHLD